MLKVPKDCIWCRHEGHTAVCKRFKLKGGKECAVAMDSADTWHKDEFKAATKKVQAAINEKFEKHHGITPRT